MGSIRELRAAHAQTWCNLPSRWYKSGIEMSIPWIANCRGGVCYYMGCCGFRWAESCRSQLLFFAFWVSVLSWLAIAAAVCSISWHPSVVEILPFFRGVVSLTNEDTGVVSKLDFYAGLNIMVIEDCSTGAGTAECPPHSQSWSSLQCDQYFDHCDDCANASTRSVVTVLIALITQFFTVMSDLQRSTVKGDFPLMKLIGVVTGIIGILANLECMNAFGNACFKDLQPSVDYVTIDRDFGAALLCLMAGTALKVLDVLVHLVVPVSEQPPENEFSGAFSDIPQVVTETSNCGLSSTAWQPVRVAVLDESDEPPPPRLVLELRQTSVRLEPPV